MTPREKFERIMADVLSAREELNNLDNSSLRRRQLIDVIDRSRGPYYLELAQLRARGEPLTATDLLVW
jgi:hypothetical protein